MKFQRAAEVKRKKAQRKERKARYNQNRETYQAAAAAKSQSTVPALLAMGLIGYFGDIEELRTDIQPFL